MLIWIISIIYLYMMLLFWNMVISTSHYETEEIDMDKYVIGSVLSIFWPMVLIWAMLKFTFYTLPIWLFNAGLYHVLKALWWPLKKIGIGIYNLLTYLRNLYE